MTSHYMASVNPYFDDGRVTIYHGDCREILPELDIAPDLVLADPPYGDTSLEWDRWPMRWVTALPASARSLWCFGSMRMFMAYGDEFEDWSLAQDVVWEKHNGSGFHADRFKRVHEHALHWYRGPWGTLYKAPQFTADATKRTVRRKERPTHMGEIADSTYTSHDGGPRLQRSVIQVRSEHGRAEHPTQKPTGILTPLIDYSCPPDGLVLDPFVGSGSTLRAAMDLGRRAIGIEIDERYCEIAARRCAQAVLPL